MFVHVYIVHCMYLYSIYSELSLDFGSCNLIGQPKTLRLIVTNNSAIPTSLSTRVTNFPASIIQNKKESSVRDGSKKYATLQLIHVPAVL